MTESHPRLRREVERAHRDVTRELEPRLQNIAPHLRQALIAQNVLRVCMETTLRATLPYDPRLLVELGTRLAAYAVTAGPPKQTHLMIETIQGLLPLMVENKQKTGSGIKADWIEP